MIITIGRQPGDGEAEAEVEEDSGKEGQEKSQGGVEDGHEGLVKYGPHDSPDVTLVSDS